MTRLRALLFLSALALFACDEVTDDSTTEGRGSDACRTWQTAYCSYAKRCGSALSNDCEIAQGVTCADDDAATKCATSLDQATCMQIPAGCRPEELADLGTAEEMCNTLIDTWCTRVGQCDGSAEMCRSNAEVAYDCTKAFSIGLTYEACIDEIGQEICGGPLFLPADCQATIWASR